MPGRDQATLAKIASSLDYASEWEVYNKKARAVPQRSYSYSLETREFYFGENPRHRKKIMDLYGDGASPIYIIAIKDIYGELPVYSEVSPEIRQIAESGSVPFVGCWLSSGGAYTGVSALFDHGITEDRVLELLTYHDQQYAAKITLEKMTYLPPD